MTVIYNTISVTYGDIFPQGEGAEHCEANEAERNIVIIQKRGADGGQK